jgi:glycosyltransferase involved in cell wall biosynthesis
MLISIVVPCFNEADVIDETILRLQNFSSELINFSVEFLFVDDGSVDGTRQKIKEYAVKDPRVKVIGFARNFGHQIAVTAGIDFSNGDIVVLIDADLQDPPELIHQMLEKAAEGYDVVYCIREKRLGESLLKKFLADLFYRILNKLSSVSIPLDTGDFRLMTRRAVDILKMMPEKDRFIRGMVSWIGFRQIGIKYQRSPRFAGQTKYPLGKMVKFALDGIISFSTKPLQLATGLGIISAFISLFGISYALYLRLFTNTWVEGWTALVIAILFMGGIQLLSLGIIGEYVGRIYNEGKNRPLYVVDEKHGFAE